jgi:hypothetical protein
MSLIVFLGEPRPFFAISTTTKFRRLLYEVCMWTNYLNIDFSDRAVEKMKQSDRCFEEIKRRSAAHMLYDDRTPTTLHTRTVLQENQKRTLVAFRKFIVK